jgi:hypothetical protein
MLPLAIMISDDVCELAVHQSNSRAKPPVRRSKRTLSKKGNVRSNQQSFDHNQITKSEPPSVQLFRQMNKIGSINQEALSS